MSSLYRCLEHVFVSSYLPANCMPLTICGDNPNLKGPFAIEMRPRFVEACLLIEQAMIESVELNLDGRILVII